METARATGASDQAAQRAADVLALDPGEAHALNLLGNQALDRRDASAARDFFARAVERAPEAAQLRLNLAIALRELGEAEAELDALNKCLALDPYMVLALLQKAHWYERRDDRRQAAKLYGDLLRAAPPADRLPPAIKAALAHAESVVRADRDDLEVAIRGALGEDEAGRRLRGFVDGALGRRRVYLQQPTGLHYPELPAIEFFDREMFDWLPRLEAATADIRQEMLAVLSEDRGFVPYVAYADGQPVNQWGKLNHSRDWSAFFLWRDGAPVEANLSRCPKTAEVLKTIPMNDVTGRSPSAFFSMLKPHTHIPAHTGVTNTRVIVHLPLVVPPHCEFRVGSETRPWREGEAWAFDDTIEHEAWNRSDETRVILIFDAWNPFLSEAEREGVRRVNRGINAHYGQPAA